jgi:hypothetical protein
LELAKEYLKTVLGNSPAWPQYLWNLMAQKESKLGKFRIENGLQAFSKNLSILLKLFKRRCQMPYVCRGKITAIIVETGGTFIQIKSDLHWDPARMGGSVGSKDLYNIWVEKSSPPSFKGTDSKKRIKVGSRFSGYLRLDEEYEFEVGDPDAPAPQLESLIAGI